MVKLSHGVAVSSISGIYGLIRVRVIRGVNLAIRDFISSDPYVVLKMGKQKLKTKVVHKNLNPEWNDELTFSVTEQVSPIGLTVFDHDLLSIDDKMGEAEIDVYPFLDAVRTHLDQNVPSGTIIRRLERDRQSCLAETSCIYWEDGKIIQKIILQLRNVEHGEVELELYWIDVPGSKGVKKLPDFVSLRG